MTARRTARALLVGLAVLLGLGVAGVPSASAADSPPAPSAGEVQVFGYVANVQSVDLEANSFTGDFVIGMRWSDPSLNPSETLRLLNVVDASSVSTTASGAPIKGEDGVFSWTERVQGVFTAPFSLRSYPFQDQHVGLVFDAPGTNIVAGASVVPTAPFISLAGFDIGTASLTVNQVPAPNVFELREAPSLRSRIILAVPLESSAIAGIVKVLLPIVIVILATLLIFLVPPDHTDGRLGLGITALLTIVALQLGTGLPNVGYLTMLDTLFMVALAFVTVSMALVIWGMWTVRNDEKTGEAAVIRRDRKAMVVLPIAYLLVNAGVLAIFLA